MNSSIFREYDIRGIADLDLKDEVVSDIGLAMGTMFKEKGVKTISLGRDCRISSDRFFNTLSTTITKTGINIIDLVMITTALQEVRTVNLGAFVKLLSSVEASQLDLFLSVLIPF